MQISEIQEMMKTLYGERDLQRGTNHTFNWLVDEVQELGDAMNDNNKESTEKEVADVLAWLASLANILDINLEKAFLKKYNHKCPRCLSSPCNCTYIESKRF